MIHIYIYVSNININLLQSKGMPWRSNVEDALSNLRLKDL